MTAPPRILVVDDSKISRMMSKALIEHALPKCIVIDVEDAQRALKVCTATDIDLAILDLNMPGMSGLELAAELKAHKPDVRLALLTASIQEGIRSKAEEIGVRFFRKPVTEAIITQILDSLEIAR